MSATKHYDSIVIGAGQGGGPLSTNLARAGRKTAIVEREHAGGSCVNEGCTPTKTMIASARAAYLARRGADYGVNTGEISVDLKKVRQRKRDIVEMFRGGSQRGLERAEGLDIHFGEARFTGTKQVEVALNDGGVAKLTADNFFINTGTRPARPDIAGLADVPTLDNRTIMELDAVPEHLIILGGGYIGIEFGQMFRRFGAQVTLIQTRDQLLPREDPDVAEEVAKILGEDGIKILFEARTEQVKNSSGKIELTVKTKDGKQKLSGSHLLVATGRAPNTDPLNPSATGVETDEQGYIKTNYRLETNVEGIYALGDVKGGPAFTHISYDDFRTLRTNLIQGGNATIRNRLVPYAVFMDPQLGRVGLSEREATAQGRKFRVGKMPMTHVARALETDETRGFMKALVDPETNQIIGAAILSIEGGEVMSVLQMAMLGKVPYTAIRDGVFAHPTLAESLNNLFMSMDR